MAEEPRFIDAVVPLSRNAHGARNEGYPRGSCLRGNRHRVERRRRGDDGTVIAKLEQLGAKGDVMKDDGVGAVLIMVKQERDEARRRWRGCGRGCGSYAQGGARWQPPRAYAHRTVLLGLPLGIAPRI